MLQIQTNDKAETIISSGFWELDRLYFAIFRFTGDYGPKNSVPFKGYGAVCENLLGLNYEIRHAEQGDRELYTQNNGIREEWFEKRSRISDTDEFDELEDNMDFNGIDLEEFYGLDREEKENILIDHGYDREEYEDYLNAFDEKSCKFRREDYPEATVYNTLLQFRISVYEALSYALIIRELLPKKDEYLEALRREAEHPSTGLEKEFYHVGVWQDLDLLDLYKNGVFRSVYRILDEEKYEYFAKAFSGHPDGFKNADLSRCNQMIVQYQEKESACDLCADLSSFLEELLGCLG